RCPRPPKPSPHLSPSDRRADSAPLTHNFQPNFANSDRSLDKLNYSRTIGLGACAPRTKRPRSKPSIRGAFTPDPGAFGPDSGPFFRDFAAFFAASPDAASGCD